MSAKFPSEEEWGFMLWHYISSTAWLVQMNFQSKAFEFNELQLRGKYL